ncbi:MAG TPA: AI-2E family transporter [Xanthobacteraceae bacterium]|nr:AI-2E family transporter [Xanthobacteraceae bacterium]
MKERVTNPRAPRARVAPSDEARTADRREPLPLHPGARLAARVILAVALTGAVIWTARDFLPALIWAAMLAIALWPLYERAAGKFFDLPSTGSALLFTLIVAVVVCLPIGVVMYEIAQQSEAFGSLIAQWSKNGLAVPDWIAHLPVGADAAAHWWRENLAKPETASAWLQKLNAANVLRMVSGQLVNRSFTLFVSLVILFFLLRNGNLIARQLLATAERILGDPGEGLVEKTVVAMRKTVGGTIVVALAEGAAIGAGYLIAGVPDPALFAILTAAFAMLPFGAWVMFSTAAAALLMTGGSGVAAGGVVSWGALVMIAGDQFVWPTLVGESVRLPFVFAFIGIFGGLASFGLMGLFLGPVIMAAFLTIWREWVMRTNRQST